MELAKLTPKQWDVMEQAYTHRHTTNFTRLSDGSFEGWFYAERHETCYVFAYAQTCKKLCGMGLMDFQPIPYGMYKRNGKWYSPNRYRISDEGTRQVELYRSKKELAQTQP